MVPDQPEIDDAPKVAGGKRTERPSDRDRIARRAGSMERQQLSGGRHDRFSSQRQRESGSSRGEVDLTLIRHVEKTPDKAPAAADEGPSPGIEGIESPSERKD